MVILRLPIHWIVPGFGADVTINGIPTSAGVSEAFLGDGRCSRLSFVRPAASVITHSRGRSHEETRWNGGETGIPVGIVGFWDGFQRHRGRESDH